MSPPLLVQGEILLPIGTEERWRERRVAHGERTLSVKEVLALLVSLETDVSPEWFSMHREGEALRFRAIIEKMPWRRSLEAILEAAAAEGGIAEMTSLDALPEPGEVAVRTTFDGTKRTDEDLPIDEGPHFESFRDALEGISAKIRNALPEHVRAAEKDGRSIASLATLALHHPLEHVRGRAIEALGALEDPNALATLLAALDQRPGDLPEWPRSAFGGAPAEQRITDEKRWLRDQASWALAKSPARDALPRVSAIYEREVGLLAIVGMAWPRARRTALPYDEVRASDEAARTMLAGIAERDLERLAAALYVLGRRGQGRCEEAWIRAWRTHPSTAIRRAACQALFALGTPRALHTLADDLGSEDADHECARAFLRIDRATAFDRAAPLFRAGATNLEKARAYDLLWGIQTEDFRGTEARPRVTDDARWLVLLESLLGDKELGWHATAILNRLRAPQHR